MWRDHKKLSSTDCICTVTDKPSDALLAKMHSMTVEEVAKYKKIHINRVKKLIYFFYVDRFMKLNWEKLDLVNTDQATPKYDCEGTEYAIGILRWSAEKWFTYKLNQNYISNSIREDL